MKRFKDFYGCSAVIKAEGDKQRLIIKTALGKNVINKLYSSYKGARAAMGRNSDGWRKEE